jgi:hypothetical protein
VRPYTPGGDRVNENCVGICTFRDAVYYRTTDDARGTDKTGLGESSPGVVENAELVGGTYERKFKKEGITCQCGIFLSKPLFALLEKAQFNAGQVR